MATTTAVALESFRVLFPETYALAGRKGNQLAAGMTLLVFMTPLLAPGLRRVARGRGRVVVLVALALWRVAVLVPEHPPLVVAVVGVIAGLLALTLVLAAPAGADPSTLGLAVLSGLAFDVAVRSAFSSWDPVWQRTPVAFVVGGLVAALLVLATWRCGQAEEGVALARSAGAGLVIGPVLALEVLFLASPAFVASSAGISLAWATLVVLGGVAVGLVISPVIARGPGLVSVAAVMVLCGSAFVLPRATGTGLVAVVLLGQGAAAVTLAAASAHKASSRGRAELGLAAGWLVFALAVMLYQLHFDQPLPVDNRWVVTAAAALTAVAIVARRRQPGLTSAWMRQALMAAIPTAVAGIVIAAGLGMTAVRTPGSPTPNVPLRVVEWNIRQAVGSSGELAPDVIASVLSRGGPPDVVVLPEAARGWPLSGDLDLASWLSRRLDLPFVWAPAADHQFGTLVLSKLPVRSEQVVRLPVAGRSQGRSLLAATLDTGGGRSITLLATHLQHRNDAASVSARAREIDVVLQRWAGAPRTIVIGDFNPRQGDPPLPARRPGEFPEIRAFLDAGFTTAQELTGCSQPTSGRNCSDFVLVTPDLHQQVEVIPQNTFDHRPLLSTIGPNG